MGLAALGARVETAPVLGGLVAGRTGGNGVGAGGGGSRRRHSVPDVDQAGANFCRSDAKYRGAGKASMLF